MPCSRSAHAAVRTSILLFLPTAIGTRRPANNKFILLQHVAARPPPQPHCRRPARWIAEGRFVWLLCCVPQCMGAIHLGAVHARTAALEQTGKRCAMEWLKEGKASTAALEQQGGLCFYEKAVWCNGS